MWRIKEIIFKMILNSTVCTKYTYLHLISMYDTFLIYKRNISLTIINIHKTYLLNKSNCNCKASFKHLKFDQKIKNYIINSTVITIHIQNYISTKSMLVDDRTEEIDTF